jgi:hypothetical protein
MSWAEALENVNFTGVLLGTLASLIIGYVWYEPRVFGKQWMELVGLKKKEMEDKQSMPVMMVMSIVFYFLVSITIAALLNMSGASGAGDGVLMGAILGFIFGYGPMSVAYVFARRRFELSMIDGGYIVVTTAVIGAVLGLVG